MKAVGGLWAQLSSWENFILAYENARKTGKYKPSAMAFYDNWEENLIILHEEVLHGMYKPSGYTTFLVHEPKPRVIEAPIYRDRIIHHAIHNVIEPIFEKSFIKDSYACRKGKGTHRAAKAVQNHLRVALRNSPNGKIFIAQFDVAGYFHHIVHKILKRLIRRKVKDERVLRVWFSVIDSGGENGVGQPIGALTSQDDANIYLDPFDHHIKDDLGIKHYARYMDDFLIIHHDKEYLKQLSDYVENWLAENLQLSLSCKKLICYTQGVDFSGYRIWPTHIKPRKRNVKAAKRRIKAQVKRGDFEAAQASIASFNGYIKHCDQRIEITIGSVLNELENRSGKAQRTANAKQLPSRASC